MKMNESCVACLLGKYEKKYPEGATQSEIEAYRNALEAVFENFSQRSAPEVVEQMELVKRRFFGDAADFFAIKRHFNLLMLSLESQMEQTVRDAEDPLRCALQYAMAGNFIDFGALDSVEEDKLREFLEAANRAQLDEKTIEDLGLDLSRASRLVYFTDNCGEIVADKVLVRTLKRLYPKLFVTVIVRGAPVLNDATMVDAEEIGFSDVADRVLENGNGVAGTVIARLSREAREAVDAADLMLAKGQGNFESLAGCGLNVYYLFMCKCKLFVDRFRVPKFSGILTREDRLPNM